MLKNLRILMLEWTNRDNYLENFYDILILLILIMILIGLLDPQNINPR